MPRTAASVGVVTLRISFAMTKVPCAAPSMTWVTLQDLGPPSGHQGHLWPHGVASSAARIARRRRQPLLEALAPAGLESIASRTRSSGGAPCPPQWRLRIPGAMLNSHWESAHLMNERPDYYRRTDL